jgi:hypothetical protein
MKTKTWQCEGCGEDYEIKCITICCNDASPDGCIESGGIVLPPHKWTEVKKCIRCKKYVPVAHIGTDICNECYLEWHNIPSVDGEATQLGNSRLIAENFAFHVSDTAEEAEELIKKHFEPNFEDDIERNGTADMEIPYTVTTPEEFNDSYRYRDRDIEKIDAAMDLVCDKIKIVKSFFKALKEIVK